VCVWLCVRERVYVCVWVVVCEREKVCVCVGGWWGYVWVCMCEGVYEGNNGSTSDFINVVHDI
jgi:hypothetical protein